MDQNSLSQTTGNEAFSCFAALTTHMNSCCREAVCAHLIWRNLLNRYLIENKALRSN